MSAGSSLSFTALIDRARTPPLSEAQQVFERDRGFADSPLEGDGFEPSVPARKSRFSCGRRIAGPNAGSQNGLFFYAVPMVRIHLPPAERWYGAGGEEMAPSSL